MSASRNNEARWPNCGRPLIVQHSRTDGRRATEVNVAVHALNRMLELGRPIPVRIA